MVNRCGGNVMITFPGDTDSKHIWVCVSNFMHESRIHTQTDRLFVLDSIDNEF